MTETELRLWRRGKRTELIRARIALPPEQRATLSAQVAYRLGDLLRTVPGEPVGLYWPMFGEIDLLHLATERAVALPYVLEKGQPLGFREWKPGDPTTRGVYDIPYPEQGPDVAPEILVVPLVGFDRDNYRLGYGGGYYDRTLAASNRKPLTIGVGFELGRLETIYPQPYDIPLDCILTEARSVKRFSQPVYPE